jgi:hypothetical protein
MKRVEQSRVGVDGTCFRACLASILDLDEDEVLDFDEGTDGDDDAYWENVRGWLAERGLSYRRVPMYSKPVGYSTIEGISPRGGLHACVALDGELLWDPHPIADGTGQGLVEPRYYGLLEPLKGRAVDAGYECQGGCGRTVERRYKNSVCQYCLDKRHKAKLAILALLRAEVLAARGDLQRYKAAVAALKAAGGKSGASDSAYAERCGSPGWRTCPYCDGRIHKAACTVKLNKAFDCVQERPCKHSIHSHGTSTRRH